MTDADLRALLHTIALRNADSQAAMTRLYRALHGPVLAFVRHRWGAVDDHEAQAVVIDALHEVWRCAGAFAGGSQVKTWVLGIARHKMLDAVRRRGATPEADDLEDHAATLADPAADLLDQLADKQRMEWLAMCMAQLPDDQRESLHLLMVEGLGVDEIASVQDCPAGTVKSRVFHAKQKLKSCLSAWLQNDRATAHADACLD